MTETRVVIVGAVRTPIGSIGGGLAPLQAEDLAAHAIAKVLEQSGVTPEDVEYTCLGWVMQDPRSPNVARNAAQRAGIPYTSPATTFHENCASGGAAIHSISRRIRLGEIGLGVAGGTESMSNVARYLFTGRTRGQLYGDMTLVDGLFGALTDTHVEQGELMGLMTERMVERYGLTREEQDEIAYRSHHNAIATWEAGLFDGYVVPVEVPRRKKEPLVVARDEGPRPVTREELAAAKPYFKRDGGTITTLNASSVNDAAAALVVASAERAAALGLADLAISNVDLFELNEAFAAVVASAFKFLPDLPADRTNQWGSGISLGHPVGCTGARQVADMVHQLHRRDGRIGVTTRCVGGGIGSGEVIERIG